MDKGDGKESSLSHSAGDEVYEDKLLGADGSKKRKDNESAQSSSSSSSVSSSASSSTQSKWVGTTQTQTTPLNPWVSPLLNDMYQITMVYAYWKEGRQNDHAVFDAFFRKNPFNGEYTVFAGLEEVQRFIRSFAFTESDIAYLRTILPHSIENEFFEYLSGLDCSQITVYALAEGTICFPRIPVMRVEGPMAVCQLLETPLLNLTNYASLITTNAVRMRLAAGEDKVLLEFGLRRAQGPDGAMSASRYAYIGGFDGTSNVAAGKAFGIDVKGTHAHSFVCSFNGEEDLKIRVINGVDVWQRANKYREELGWSATNDGELASFVAYAVAFPTSFLALVDTYDTLNSGVKNFLCVALVLKIDLGYTPLGIRLDSGDLAYLSVQARQMFITTGEKYSIDFSRLTIVASNDINEEVLHSLDEQGHSIDSFGIGTNLVTCQAQPALGMVYKLVEVHGLPTIKISNEIEKVTIPGKKSAYRLIGSEGLALCDVLVLHSEQPPVAGKRILVQHPFVERKRAYVTPSFVIELLRPVWRGPEGLCAPSPTPSEIREYVKDQLKLIRSDHKRSLNPAAYKVSVTAEMFQFIHSLWISKVSVPELS